MIGSEGPPGPRRAAGADAGTGTCADAAIASWAPEGAGAHDATLCETWLFRLRRERFRSRRSGQAHDFYITELADGVHVIAITPENEMVLVRQFRAGAGRDCLETPGGLIDPGESVETAGARELLEETGYAGGPAERIGPPLWPNPALLTMKIATVVIRDARRTAEPRPDRGEEVAVELVPIDSVPGLIQDGRIDHAVCVAGLLWWLAVDARAGKSGTSKTPAPAGLEGRR